MGELASTLNQEASLALDVDPVNWILNNFWIPELRGPIQLEEYQKRCLREALSRDENGKFKYSTIIWSDIKKSAKSSIAAAVALWLCMNTEWAEVYCVANDLKQADTRVNHYMRRALMLNPFFKGKFKPRGYTTRFLDTHSRFEALPIDPSGEAGSNADAIFFSELWGAHEEQKRRMWTEMTLSPTKHGHSFRWVESYAGYSEESLLLWDLYEQGVINGEQLWPDLEAYANPTARLFTLWNTTPKCPWQTQEYYAAEAAMLPPNEFERMHRNTWVTSSDTFVPAEWYDACQVDPKTIPPLRKNEPVVVAADAAYSKDTFGIVMVSRHPNEENTVIVRYAQRWIPPERVKLDFFGTPEHPGPERELRRLFDEYNVVMMAYDPYQLHDMATRFRTEGLVWAYEFSQAKNRWIADSDLRARIREKRIWHTGQDVLREHVLNANAKVDEKEDKKIRLIKRSINLPIDLAVCLSMASHECARLNL